jgi:predicted aminopeptidase
MFNEAYASFVEAAGVERWLVSRQSGQDELRRWQEREAAGDDFNRLMHDARQEFTALYDADYSDNLIRAEKARRFAQLRQRYDRLVHEIWGGQSYFSGWMGEDLNNAHLVAIGAYAGGRCAFDSLLRSAEGEFEAFHELARELAERPREQRRAWLNQSCPAVAPAPEL